jgi:hypothetical protein
VRTSGNREKLQREIALLAARHVAEHGDDWARARDKAAAQVCGAGARPRGVLPDHAQLEAALREYLRTFAGPRHREWLRRLRGLALRWMQTLERFHPYLVGPVLDGSATLHSALDLNLYTENAKEVEMALLDLGIRFRVDFAPAGQAHAQQVIGFLAPLDGGAESGLRPPASVPVRLTIFDPVALRTAPPARASDPELHRIERSGRAAPAMVRQLLEEPGPDPDGVDV